MKSIVSLQSLSPGKIRFRLDSINTLRRTVCSIGSSIEVKYHDDLAVTGARFVRIKNIFFC